MNTASLARFAQRAAEQRRDVFSTCADATVGGVAVKLIYTEPTQTQKLDDGGWDERVTVLARIVRSDIPSGLSIDQNTVFVLAGRTLLVVQIKDHPAHPEVVYGLREP